MENSPITKGKGKPKELIETIKRIIIYMHFHRFGF